MKDLTKPRLNAKERKALALADKVYSFIEDQGDELPDKDIDFLESVHSQLKVKPYLSEKQRDWLEDILGEVVHL